MDRTIQLVNSVNDIQAMPNVIVKVLNLMKEPKVNMKTLGDLVMYDQSLTIKMLALVNSAYYGFSQQINSISMALSLLGMVKVKNIIVAVAMKPMMSNQGDKDLWKHSIKTAAGCEYLSQITKIMDTDEAFIAGFVHDVGKIVLHMSSERVYTKVLSAVADGADILEAEENYYNSNHVKTGALLAKRWQLPILLSNIILYHHNPKLSSMPVPCSLIRLVDQLVQTDFKPEKIDKDFLKTIGIDFNDIENLRENILDKAELLIADLT